MRCQVSQTNEPNRFHVSSGRRAWCGMCVPCARLSKAGEGIIALEGKADVRSAAGHWMESLFHAQDAAGLVGAHSSLGCVDMHVGTVGAGKSRGNHRHHNKNETIILWGAAGLVRVERPGEVVNDYRLKATDRVLIASPSVGLPSSVLGTVSRSLCLLLLPLLLLLLLRRGLGGGLLHSLDPSL
jgi:hypothetical protein